MSKGKFGLSLAAIAAIAFGFTVLRQPQSVLLVAGFALLAEKNEWLNRQVMQALLLTIVYYVADLVTEWIFGGLVWFFGWAKLYEAVIAMNKVNAFVSGALYIALIVLAVYAVLRVLRGKDAGLPFLSKTAVGANAPAPDSRPRAAETAAQTAPPVQAVPTQTQYASPAQPASPRTPPIEAQAAPAPVPGLCPACSAPLHEGAAFCTECGAKTK